MKTVLKSTLMIALCAIVLASCGKKDETPDEGASINAILNQDDINEALAEGCPDFYDPVCSDKNITYDNACFAEAAGATGWQPGEC